MSYFEEINIYREHTERIDKRINLNHSVLKELIESVDLKNHDVNKAYVILKNQVTTREDSVKLDIVDSYFDGKIGLIEMENLYKKLITRNYNLLLLIDKRFNKTKNKQRRNGL